MASVLLQKIQGAMLGHALGDALGAPHEFRPYGEYSGHLESPIIRLTQWQGKQVTAVGQVTDDTEMAMALLWSMENGFSEDRTVKEYMHWANSKIPFMGKNTKVLFYGVKTVQGYRKRYAKQFPDEASRERNQSNGVLMRGYVLAFVQPDISNLDASLTNPSRVAVEAVEVYTTAIRMALMGASKQEIMDSASAMITSDVLRTAFDQARNNQFRNVTKDRGWVTHAFYCTFWGFVNFDDYGSAIHAIICLSPKEGETAKICERPGVPTYPKNQDSLGDTDTNAAIAGALLGAYYGIMGMCADPVTAANMQVLIRADPNSGSIPRPDRYTMNWNNFLKLSGIAYNLFKKNFGIPGGYATTSPSPIPNFSSETEELDREIEGQRVLAESIEQEKLKSAASKLAEDQRLLDTAVQQEAMDRQRAQVVGNQRVLDDVMKQKETDRKAQAIRKPTTAKREDAQARQVAEFLEVPVDTQEVVPPDEDVFEFAICLGLIPQ
jgi:ADP-ribosyl-[dinitrogen reductase] hydrolase